MITDSLNEMMINARFTHVNLVARDWRRLVEFYEKCFGCQRIGPIRDLSGETIVRGTGIPGARIQGAHLELPGLANGPTLEIFQYTPAVEELPKAVNRAGFGHIAFAVDDVDAAAKMVRAEGGGVVAETVTGRVAGAGHVTFAYVTDPEGNIIELQHWKAEPAASVGTQPRDDGKSMGDPNEGII